MPSAIKGNIRTPSRGRVYRSARAVPRSPINTPNNYNVFNVVNGKSTRALLLMTIGGLLFSATLFPFLIFSNAFNVVTNSDGGDQDQQQSKTEETFFRKQLDRFKDNPPFAGLEKESDNGKINGKEVQALNKNVVKETKKNERKKLRSYSENKSSSKEDQQSQNEKFTITEDQLLDIPHKPRPASLARGTSGIKDMSKTPALVGAQRGEIHCDVNVDFLAYWNDPIGDSDMDFQAPFADTPGVTSEGGMEEKYVTFEPDKGGWNNIRMSMEIIVVFAAATGRTLVLPPDLPIYLLKKAVNGKKTRGFGDFFPLHSETFQNYANLKVISFAEFLEREGARYPFENDDEKKTTEGMDSCFLKEKGDKSCMPIFRYLRRIGHTITGSSGNSFNNADHCFIFDETLMDQSASSIADKLKDDTAKMDRINNFCMDHEPVYYDKTIRESRIIHFPALLNEYRFLTHFYTFLHFTNPKIDNRYKRYIRDFLHYHDEIYCAAGKVILALQEEAKHIEGFENSIDEEGGGGYSSFHVRRGDFQFKKQKISAKEWYENSKDQFPNESELMYIATDERDKTFFNDMSDHYQLRFLDDYWDLAGLDDLDPNYMGMVDTIIASRGRVFFGTWFSTFTGYINRMRGYHGMSMDKSFYGVTDRKFVLQESDYFPSGNPSAREYSLGWIGIDGDKFAGGYNGKDEWNSEEDEMKNSVESPNVISIIESPDRNKSLARGLSGLPISETPALIGASRGQIQCDVDTNNLVYWNQPQGKQDIEFKSPFIGENNTVKPKYLTFQPDRGGWNNIRMNLEVVFIFAAATGRTLVLPPDVPMYLMAKAGKDKNRHRGFGDFIPIHEDWFQERIKVISMEEFVALEGGSDGQFPIPTDLVEGATNAAKACDKRKKSDRPCDSVFEYLEQVAYVPEISSKSCLVFDEDVFNGNTMPKDREEKTTQFCNALDDTFYFTKKMQGEPLIHISSDKEHRIMAHFYGVMTFTNPAIDNHFKRFVRDFLHYHDEIYCAAGKIVNAIQKEGQKLGFKLDAEGGGGYASMHVRRGDLQYKKVKISAEEWKENLEETWKEKEIIYIATDERDKTFFDPLRETHELRFLDDYWDMANLGDLDPNYMGMIDTIVASRGRTFGGTFFSTFTGYINRMRGYHGMSMKDSYYGWNDRKTITHTWEEGNKGKTFSYEWPTGWIGIDGDKTPSRDKF